MTLDLTPQQEAARSRLADYWQAESLPCLCGHEPGWQRTEVDRVGIGNTLIVCDWCGLIRLDPRPTPETLERFYSSGDYRVLYSPETAEAQFRRKQQHAARLASELGKQRFETVVEIGTGTGGFLAGLAGNADRLIGYDVSPVYFCRGLLPTNAELRLVSDDEPAPASADLLIASHVLEHMHNPVAALLEWKELLKPGGQLLLAVPTVNDIRKLGSLDNFVQLPHLWHFSEHTLMRLLRACGFECLTQWDGFAVAWPVEGVVDAPQHERSGEAPRVIAEIHEHSRVAQRVHKIRGRLGGGV